MEYSEGVKKYVERGKRILAEREELKSRMKKARFDTIAVHGLYSTKEALENNQGSIIEPMYLSTSQGYRDSDEMEAGLAYLIPTWCYSRIANPSTYYLEWTLALLEGYRTGADTSCLVTGSGMSAIRSATEPFLVHQEGENNLKMNFVSSCQVYGGTFQLFNIRYAEERGIELRWVKNPADTEEWQAKIDENTRFVFGEAPSNPQQSFCDMAAIAKMAHAFGAPMIMDSTCATPALMRPIEHGVDIVVHSLTKSITTSGFAVGGALISRNPITTRIKNENPLFTESFADYVKFLPYRDTGPAASPFNALMAQNDLRTLRPRMDRLSRNSQTVAEFLESHPKVSKVDYLGLESNSLHRLASKYMKLADDGAGRYGHLMGMRVDGSAEDTRRVLDALKMFHRATDLGRIKSVATIPAISTHQQQGEEGRDLADVPPQLMRLCIGGESAEDIIGDLDQALATI